MWWGLTPVSLSWPNKFWAPRAPTAERITGRVGGRLGTEVLALRRWTNTNNDINNETFKTHNCVREREREKERERELTELERREVHTKKPLLEILWCDDDLDSLHRVWNSGTTWKTPPKRKFHTKTILGGKISKKRSTPVYVRRVHPWVLQFSLSLHRHPYTCVPCSSLFIYW
jgi:hypothetical protein